MSTPMVTGRVHLGTRDASSPRGDARASRALAVAGGVCIVGAIMALAETGAADITVPILVAITCISTVLVLLNHDASFFWSPIIWFLTACGLYFGFGPLAYPFGSSAALRTMDSYFYVDQHALNRTNGLNALAIAVTCFAYQIGSRRYPRYSAIGRPAGTLTMQSRRFHVRVAMCLIAMGVVSRLLLSAQSGVQLGSLSTMQGASLIGLVILCYLVATGQRQWLILLVIGGLFELTFRLQSLMKQNVIEMFLFLIAGVYLAKPSKRVALVGASCAVALYMALVPFVIFSRAQARGEVAGSAAELIRVFNNQTIGSASAETMESQSAWTRVSYANSQGFAMAQYDNDMPGSSFASIGFVLVPRLLWPDKPIMTTGADYNYLVTGSASSDSAPGIFAEAYWNFGWLGVIALCSFVGVFFARIASEVSVRLIRDGDIRWLVLALFGIRIGYRPDDWFVPAYIGSLPILAAIMVFLYFAAPFHVRRVAGDTVGPTAS